MPKYILSDPQQISLIKKLQFQHQIPSLALVVIAFLLNLLMPNFNMHYPSLGLALIGVIWYMYVGLCFRFKQRIPALDSTALLSPITGRIRYVKTASDISQLKIGKSAVDLVEIRSPHADCMWEGETLKLVYQGCNLTFRFEANKLIRFENANMAAGHVIGVFSGAGSCYLSLPKPLNTGLRPKELCEAGLTSLIAE